MIHLIRVLLLAIAIACGAVGLYLSGLILAIGSVVLAPWDIEP